MHPIVSEQIARSRMQELHRQAEVARRLRAARRPRYGVRVALASAALRLARALDREGRVVPTPARAIR